MGDVRDVNWSGWRREWIREGGKEGRKEGRKGQRSDGCAGLVHVRGGWMDLALCMALMERGFFLLFLPILFEGGGGVTYYRSG